MKAILLTKTKFAVAVMALGVLHVCHASYTELVSITATGWAGQQWITTQYRPSLSDSFECKFRLNSSTDSMALWCARSTSTYTGSYTCFVLGGKFRLDHNSQTSGTTALGTTDDVIVSVNGKDGSWTVNGELQPAAPAGSDVLADGYMSLFASHMAGTDLNPGVSIGNPANLVFYYLKVYDKDGNLIHYYVPAGNDDEPDNSKAKYGVLDIAGETPEFHPNRSTTAAFVPGEKKPVEVPDPGIFIQGGEAGGLIDPVEGKYDLADGELLTCRANAETNVTTWTRSRASGYALENFDLTKGIWGERVCREGSVYEYQQHGQAVQRLTWIWSHEARLTASCNAADGQVSVAGGAAGASAEGWTEIGGSISVTAIDTVSTRTFDHWVGDVPTGLSRDRTIVVPLDAAKNVTAVFLPVGDTDSLVTALADAHEGDVIVVPPGVYKLTTQLTIPQANVTLLGNDADPMSVILDGDGRCRCLKTVKQGVTLSGLTFRNGYDSSEGGAGVYCYYATVTNCHFEGNVVLNKQGGGIYAQNGATIVDCVFNENIVSNNPSSSYGGGGIYHYDKSGEIRGCTFRGNMVVNGNCNCGGGAAIKASRGPDWTIRDCFFTRNSAGYGTITGVPKLISDCIFSNDLSYAAFLYDFDAGSSLMTTTVVQRCTVRDTSIRAFQGREGRGRVAFDSCQFLSFDLDWSWGVVDRSCIYEVDAGTGGSGVGILSMSNCVVRGVTTRDGMSGGEVIIGTERCADIYGCTFDDINVRQGTAAIVLGNDARLRNSKFMNSRLGYSGSGSCAVQIKGTNVAVESCLFVSNRTTQAAGTAICMGLDGSANYSAHIDNCTFAYNMVGGTTAGSCGGTITLTTKSLVRNCLFYRNSSGVAGRQVYNTQVGYDACKQNFINCWEADAGTQLADSPGCTVDNATDLKFVDPDPYTSQNFEIAKHSPLVDAGVDLDWINPKTLDIRKDGRYKRLYGECPDIGAYEYGALPGMMIILR